MKKRNVDRDGSTLPEFDLEGLRVGRYDEALLRACHTIGGVIVRTPELCASGMMEALRTAARFFELPLAERLEMSNSGRYRGYIPLQDETWECMEVGESAPRALVHPEYLFDSPSQWPDEARLSGWRQSIARYQSLMRSLAGDVMQAIIHAACGQRADGLLASASSTLRILRYRPLRAGDRVRELKAHTDSGYLTLIVQDDIGGLQLRDPLGDWREIPPTDGIVCLVGDMLRALSNKRAVAPVHRTIVRAPQPRLSLAYFLEPASGQRIAPMWGHAAHRGGGATFVYGEYLQRKIRAEFAEQYDRIVR